jgi:hypothetical protein
MDLRPGLLRSEFFIEDCRESPREHMLVFDPLRGHVERVMKDAAAGKVSKRFAWVTADVAMVEFETANLFLTGQTCGFRPHQNNRK